MKSKVAPISIGQGDNQPKEKKKKRVSFESKSLTEERSSNPAACNAVLDEESHPLTLNNDTNQHSPRSKISSCPERIFPTDAATPQQAAPVDGSNNELVSSRPRRRAHSMPAGSLASQNFFADPKFGVTGVSMYKLQTHSERKKHISGEYDNHRLDGLVQAREYCSMDTEKNTVADAKEQTNDATELKLEHKATQKDASTECQCIIL
eukprot:CAMPEP_0183705574 /NCGR_PEP_ID=MMETSP0737-20130205/2629_1 /TAXON_ID=385413 /ORGANISM="Thalassiosira miniscula, Strain CCMP1093" /LENGTH=206 /DNA_ID=CAMNT_0025932751 /DNA_START=169 /DNA_END=789 /DNA_ORIENTATION=+